MGAEDRGTMDAFIFREIRGKSLKILVDRASHELSRLQMMKWGKAPARWDGYLGPANLHGFSRCFKFNLIVCTF